MRDDHVTPRALYIRRRDFLALGAGSVVTAAALSFARPARAAGEPSPLPVLPDVKKGPFATNETQTPYKDVMHYNNYYEFGTGKGDPAANAGGFAPRPWKVTFEGEIRKPQSVDIDELMKWVPLEERIYRMRCVEAWSMVVPWVGMPLGDVIRRLEPTPKAKYVAFTGLFDQQKMPGQRLGALAWPYVEGLRLAFAAGGRPVRARPSQPERRPRAARGAVEVRLQGDQGHHEDPFCREGATDDLEPHGAGRVRLLREREPRSRPSPVEPG